MKSLLRRIAFASIFAVVVGCRTFSPTPMDEVGFKERAESQTEKGVTARVDV